MENQPLETPNCAAISYGVAIIPTTPLKDQVATASMQVSRSFENDNVIDNSRFPAHVSLYLGGTNAECIPAIAEGISRAISPYLHAKLRAERLYSGSGGFIGIDITVDSTMRALFETALAACAQAHATSQVVRPHLTARWPRLTQVQRDLIKKWGTYKVEPSGLHISVAQVPREDLNSAFVIARKVFTLPTEFGIESVQVVDVGHRNEKWSVLWSSAGT